MLTCLRGHFVSVLHMQLLVLNSELHEHSFSQKQKKLHVKKEYKTDSHMHTLKSQHKLLRQSMYMH